MKRSILLVSRKVGQWLAGSWLWHFLKLRLQHTHIEHHNIAPGYGTDFSNRYQILSEMTSDYLYSARINADGQIVHEWMSDQFVRITGYTPEDLGLSGFWTQLIYPEDLAIVEQAFALLLAGQSYTQSFRIITKHGAVRFLQEYARPEVDSAGRVQRIYGAVKDVTEQHLAEAALRTSERNLRLIAENTSDCVFAYDMEQHLLYVNSAFEPLTGYSVAELVEQQFIHYVHPADYERMMRLFASTFHGNAFDDAEFQIITKQGERKWCSSSCGPLLDDTGKQIGVQGRERDISARRKLESDRQEVERKLQETKKLESLAVLAGGIAHDFNNLLQAIYGNANLALLDLTPADPLHEPLVQIELASQRAADLVQQLLAYAGKGSILIQPVDLNQIIREMIGFLRPSIAYSITISSQLASVPFVMADHTQVRQVLLNLLTNAAEAMNSGHGSIQLTTQQRQFVSSDFANAVVGADLAPGQYVVIEVIDDGSGMDEATRAHIFEPFFTTRFTGRGLGLAAVLGIMRTANGALLVESELGQGTCFTLIFPSAKLPAAQPAVAAQPWRNSSAVLVIDDEESVRNVTQRALERIGFQVYTAADGISAVALYQQHSDIACVLLDLSLPDVPSNELARQLLALNPDVPIIVMSGYSHGQIRERIGEIGPIITLEKPFTTDNLSAALQQAIGSKP